jgi:hypothetical protein
MIRHKKPRKSKRAKRTTDSPPDLSQIVYAFWDAHAFVWTAHQVMKEGHCGPEEAVLRQGVETLKKLCEQLDSIESELSRLRRGTGGAS